LSLAAGPGPPLLCRGVLPRKMDDTEFPFVAVADRDSENRSPGELRPPGFSFATDFGHANAV
jgi:hypothetical protein